MKADSAASRGFTLIELMSVIAVISVLVAIAIPQYQNYVVRSRWADNFQSVATLKQAIAECLQNNASALTSCDTSAKLTNQGFFAAAPLPTPPFATVPVTLTVNTAEIVIVGSTQAGSCTVTLSPTPNSSVVVWTFSNTAPCNRIQTGVGT